MYIHKLAVACQAGSVTNSNYEPDSTPCWHIPLLQI